jgi:hypothetical protein
MTFFSNPLQISVTFKLLIIPDINLNEDDSFWPVFFLQVFKSLLTHFGVDVTYGYSL